MNARTSILAAANPVGGRYDRTKSLKVSGGLFFDLSTVFPCSKEDVLMPCTARYFADLENLIKFSILNSSC